MAAATQAGQTQWRKDGHTMFRVQFSGLTSDQSETLSYNYASMPGGVPNDVKMRINNAPTARCGVFMECDPTRGDSILKTIPVRFYTETGGDMAGAVVDVILEFATPGSTTAGITPV